MNPVAEKMIREAFEKENSGMNLNRHMVNDDQYANLLAQNRWMGWQQATEFWIQGHAPIVVKRRGK